MRAWSRGSNRVLGAWQADPVLRLRAQGAAPQTSVMLRPNSLVRSQSLCTIQRLRADTCKGRQAWGGACTVWCIRQCSRQADALVHRIRPRRPTAACVALPIWLSRSHRKSGKVWRRQSENGAGNSTGVALLTWRDVSKPRQLSPTSHPLSVDMGQVVGSSKIAWSTPTAQRRDVQQRPGRAGASGEEHITSPRSDPVQAMPAPTAAAPWQHCPTSP